MIERAANPPDRGRTDALARHVAYAYALIVAGTLGHFLLGLPIQVSDSFGNMLKLSSSWSDLFYSEFTQHAYLRPMMWAHLKAVHDLSGGNYFAWFRGAHVVQVVILVLLFLALVRPRSWRDTAILPFGLAVLFGMHTFTGTVREAFPLNTFMTILICCFAAAVIALAPYRWWNDVLAVLLFAFAALTVETGLLVWVVFVGAALTGARGVSKLGLGALAALLVAYFYVRFGPLAIGAPGLVERSSGFGFRMLEQAELVERFGSDPTLFYAYNVVTSALSVLLGEPSGGVFGVTHAVTTGTADLVMLIQVMSSTAVTLLIAMFIATRWRRWRAGALERDDRLVLLFVFVLAANAAISYPYTKDVIMSPAGTFLAVAAFAAARHAANRIDQLRYPEVAVLAASAALLVGFTWAVRVERLHLALREAAVVERRDWAYIDSDVERGAVKVPDARASSLMRTLQHDALVRHPAPPPLDLPLARWLEAGE